MKKAIKVQTESRVFLVSNVDHYKEHLMTKYMKKSNKWSGFTEKDIEVIRQDLEDAINTLHRQGIKCGLIDEERILVDEVIIKIHRVLFLLFVFPLYYD